MHASCNDARIAFASCYHGRVASGSSNIRCSRVRVWITIGSGVGTCYQQGASIAEFELCLVENMCSMYRCVVSLSSGHYNSRSICICFCPSL